MQYKITFRIICLIVSVLLLTTLAPFVAGDGGFYYKHPDIEKWLSLPQEKQIGIINYKDGYEKLILVINVKNSSLQGERAVWIFPVPSDPENVNIDILDTVPQLEGDNVRDLFDDAVNEIYPFFYLSQLYTLPVILTYFYVSGGMLGTGALNQYNIYEHIEKKGLTTEKVGANNSEAFQSYLELNSLSLPEESNSILDEYIDQNYCFIVTWISDVEEFRKEALLSLGERYGLNDYGYIIDMNTGKIIGAELSLSLGVSINFPIEKIYYPLKLTSAYGNETIPIFIQVLDYVTPSRYPDVTQNGFMKINYYKDKFYSVPSNLTSFFAEQIERNGNIEYGSYKISNIRYTGIEIYSKANSLTEDLWIDDSSPLNISIIDFIVSNAWIFVILIFAISSCVASLLAGFIVYHAQKPIFYKFFLLGLTNFLTIIGFFILSYSLNINQNFIKKKNEERFEGDIFKKKRTKILFVVIFSVLFIFFFSLSQFVLLNLI